MSSRAQVILLLTTIALSVTACGFQPLYGDRSDTQIDTELASISVGVIANRTGQILRNELQTQLNPNNQGGPTQYSLAVNLNESISLLAVRRDASATRANLTLTANYTMTSNQDQSVMERGFVRTTNSYDILSTENEFGTLTAKEEARKRAAKDLAGQITTRLSLVLDRLEANNRRNP